jgi:hypothetical protein
MRRIVRRGAASNRKLLTLHHVRCNRLSMLAAACMAESRERLITDIMYSQRLEGTSPAILASEARLPSCARRSLTPIR